MLVPLALWLRLRHRNPDDENVCTGNHIGATLVAVPDWTAHAKLMRMIDAFRDEVDRQLPGMYAWFDDESLHITLRALS